MKKITTVPCPQCKKEAAWDSGNRYRPFCSERCKMIDLGQWVTESYRIPHPADNPENESSHQA